MVEKYGFVYIWFDKKHKRFYIGSHYGTTDDGYVCSSSWMKQAYKHRPQDFKRRILKTNIERSELIDNEYYWLSFIKENELGKRYYNLASKRVTHWHVDEQQRLLVNTKISLANKGKIVSNETKQKISEATKGISKPWFKDRIFTIEHKEALKLNHKCRKVDFIHPFKNKELTNEHKQKISKASKGNQRLIGYKQSEEHKQKISEALKGRKLSEERKEQMKLIWIKRKQNA